MDNNIHVAIVSSPGMGHLIPVLVLADRLAARHSVHVTVLQITSAAASPPPESSSLLAGLPLHRELVRVVHLPPVDISHLVGPATHVVTQLCLMVRAAMPLVRSAVAAMDPRPDALIADLFCTETSPIAAELGLAKYLYVPTTAWFTALTVYCPRVLDREIKGQYVDLPEPLELPGCKPVRPEEVVDPMLDRADEQYEEYKRIGEEFLHFDGILLNTCQELELETLRTLRENETWRSIIKIPIYPIGPLTRPVELVDLKSELIGWLDRQPDDSVIFVSFGSGGMLSAEQITELAWGLELSQQRFVWVVRPPISGGSVDEAFFGMGSDVVGAPNYLPDGFTARTKDKGFLVPMWAPQAKILDHRSIGGFMSHCGWNSTLESITSGVPMIAWPLYAEQRLNATLLTEEIGVAVRPRVLPTKAVVGREEIERLVRRLMEDKEGEIMRDKVKKLKISVMEGLNDGGPSHRSMCEMLSAVTLEKGRLRHDGMHGK